MHLLPPQPALPVAFALVQQVSKAEVHPLEAKNGVTSLTFVQICVWQLVWGLNVTWLFEYVLCVCAQSLSCVQLFATTQAVARQASLSMGFSGKNTGLCCHFLLQGIFLSQGLNLNLLHWESDSLPVSHLGSP